MSQTVGLITLENGPTVESFRTVSHTQIWQPTMSLGRWIFYQSVEENAWGETHLGLVLSQHWQLGECVPYPRHKDRVGAQYYPILIMLMLLRSTRFI